jgi:hypothetical protein
MSENSSNIAPKADSLRIDLPLESIGPVYQLPQQVRSKWETRENGGPEDADAGELPDLPVRASTALQQVCFVFAMFDKASVLSLLCSWRS